MKVIEKNQTDWITRGKYEISAGKRLIADFTEAVLDFNKYVFDRYRSNLPENFIQELLLITKDRSRSAAETLVIECIGHIQNQTDLVFSFDFPEPSYQST